MSPLGLKAMMWSWELLGTLTFVACVADGLVVPRAFHASQLLEQLASGAPRGAGPLLALRGHAPAATVTADEVTQITRYVRELQRANGVD
jgi:hypothetical protein